MHLCLFKSEHFCSSLVVEEGAKTDETNLLTPPTYGRFLENMPRGRPLGYSPFGISSQAQKVEIGDL